MLNHDQQNNYVLNVWCDIQNVQGNIKWSSLEGKLLEKINLQKIEMHQH